MWNGDVIDVRGHNTQDHNETQRLYTRSSDTNVVTIKR